MSNTMYSEAKRIQDKHKENLKKIYNRPPNIFILPPIPVKKNKKKNNWSEAEESQKKHKKNLTKINDRLPSIGKGIKTKKKKIEILKTIY